MSDGRVTIEFASDTLGIKWWTLKFHPAYDPLTMTVPAWVAALPWVGVAGQEKQ